MATQAIERLEQQQQQHLLRAKLVIDTAEREQRSLTADEEKSVNENTKAVDDLDKRIAKARGDAAMVDQLQQFAGGTPSAGLGGVGSWGSQFASGIGDFFKKGEHRRGGAWQTPSIELRATTLGEGAGSGGGLVISDVQPQIIPLPTRRIVVADLLAPGTTNSNAVAIMQETAMTNAAAAVAEGGAKPESALVFAQVVEPVRKIAHWLPCTEEILEDVAQLRSYVDTRLRLGVQLAEDDQLLNGSGVAPNLVGLLTRAGLAADVVKGTDTNADAIAKQIGAIATASNLPPDGIIMHPTNFLAIQLGKNTAGDYYGDGPFSAPGAPTLWGLPVALTTAIVLGTALVGSFKLAAQVFRHGGIRVDASNSHQDFFVKNLVAIRAEERLALAVYRPSAMGKVTGLV